MALVSYSALLNNITGKLAGSVFQDSFGGPQIRSRVCPRNPRSYHQQLVRGDFAFISASWRSLTSSQRQSFIDAASSPGQGFNLFMESNLNLAVLGLPMLTSFIPSAVPADMPMRIDLLSPPVFSVSASGIVATVPADTMQVVYASLQHSQSAGFINNSMFSPITAYPAGSLLTFPDDIGTAYQFRFGPFIASGTICIKSSLINTTNGLRTDSATSCSNF
jgi:hypothetical protein